MQKSVFFCARLYHFESSYFKESNPRGVVAKVLDCDTVVCEFKLQSCAGVYFRTYKLFPTQVCVKQYNCYFSFKDGYGIK